MMNLDLGIEPDKICKKYKAILTQMGIKEVADYDDMSGTLFIAGMFGFLLMLRGKIQFGYIYGCGLTGCMLMCLLINLLTKKGVYVELYSCMSILGYSLLPFCILASGSLFFDLVNPIGIIFCFLIIGWSTLTATRFFAHSLDMGDQKYLIAYPTFLFYTVFLLLCLL